MPPPLLEAGAPPARRRGGWAEPERKLKDTPQLIRLPSGYIQPSPWLAIANKQLELMFRYMTELGLSPVSRSRVATIPRPMRKPWEDDGLFPGLDRPYTASDYLTKPARR